MAVKPLPIGIDDFGKLISSGFYYVDKSMLVKELLDRRGGGKSVHPSAPLWQNLEYEHAEVLF